LEFKISSKSNPKKIAGAIISALKDAPSVTLNAIGASAVNQAVKAAAVARRHSPQEIIFYPEFADGFVEGRSLTIIQITVEKTA